MNYIIIYFVVFTLTLHCSLNFPGKIVANQTVDFEQVQWLNFTIRAQDHGTPPRMAELPVYLRIVDVNDNNPIFVQPTYHVLYTCLTLWCRQFSKTRTAVFLE